MSLELVPYYEHTARKDNPYTHLLQTKIPSIGQKNGCRVPDLLLTMQYKLDAKGYVMEKPQPKLTFQTDGPSDAQLNFRHGMLRFIYNFSVCRFEVSMDAVFGEGVVVKENTTVGGTFGMDKLAKGELQVSTEFGKEAPGTRTHLHGTMYGMLTAKQNLLEAWGELL